MFKVTLSLIFVAFLAVSSVFAANVAYKDGYIAKVQANVEDGRFTIFVINLTDKAQPPTTINVFTFYRTGATGSTTGRTLSDASFKQAYAAALTAVAGGLSVRVVTFDGSVFAVPPVAPWWTNNNGGIIEVCAPGYLMF